MLGGAYRKSISTVKGNLDLEQELSRFSEPKTCQKNGEISYFDDLRDYLQLSISISLLCMANSEEKRLRYERIVSKRLLCRKLVE